MAFTAAASMEQIRERTKKLSLHFSGIGLGWCSVLEFGL